MISPRRTRLIRVADLRAFRQTLSALCTAAASAGESCAVVVPTRAAADVFAATLARPPRTLFDPVEFVTRDRLYDLLHGLLPDAPRRLTAFERDAMAQAAAEEAAQGVGDLPFQVRPGLVSELLRFYDQLRRQSQQVQRFEELIVTALGGGDTADRGADRLHRQTMFLAEAFRAYERRVAASGGCDEHGLRALLLATPASSPLRRVIVTVPDWIADPAGLFVADFDLLARLPSLAALDVLCTTTVLGSGFHERIHQWWPGLEEVESDAGVEPPVRPRLARPPDADADRLWFTYRDREDEMQAVANRLAAPDAAPPLARTAIVFKRPLPYLYLAPNTLGAAGIPWQAADALPLAAEPVIASIDLLLDAVETEFSRDSLIALLRSPHLAVVPDGAGGPPARESIAALSRWLSDTRFLGGVDRFISLASADPPDEAGAAMVAAQLVVNDLAALGDRHPASTHLTTVIAFLERRYAPLPAAAALAARESRGRRALFDLLRGLADAHAAHHDPLWTIEDLAAAVRRWVGEFTFDADRSRAGVHLLDDHAAPYGDFDDVTIVGLIENEWPDRPRRNIFYPPSLLKALGWPSEKDRQAAADARFLDLLASSSSAVALSTFTLDDEALVTRSVQLDEVPRARLSTVTREAGTAAPLPTPSQWDPIRSERSPQQSPQFHGTVGARPSRPWSVSALETYLGCPFRFFAQHVLRLEEEPDDEEVMDPRKQGQFVHEVFEEFFKAWQAAGHGAITAAELPAARALFAAVVDRLLPRVPESERSLERTRLLGSPAAAGLGEAVFRMEVERQTPVIERLLEHTLEGTFTVAGPDGERSVALRGKVDRIDLLADGTFRLIDYKLGWPPQVSKALQLPIYGVCAEQALGGRGGRRWQLGEAAYLAFKGPRRVVPLFSTSGGGNRDEVLRKAQERLVATIDAIGRGEFPPTPDDLFRCETCAFAAVCRKDYVGTV